MKIHLSFIPGKVQHAAAGGARLGQELKDALQSNKAIAAEALVDKYFPSAASLRGELISLVDAAAKTCQKIATEDWSGVTARLQRLTTDTTALLHGKKRSISTYIQWVEVVIRDILDGGSGVNKDAEDDTDETDDADS